MALVPHQIQNFLSKPRIKRYISLMEDCGFTFEHTYTKLPEVFFTRHDPVPVATPKIVILNQELACSMGLDFSGLSENDKAILFAGNKLPDNAKPYAQAYAGHQFGHFTMLGDGRAIVWGEHITPDKKRLDVQFKGAGRTPYSRSGDGRAALGPMLREYIISEAMHALQIPTTRSLTVVQTGEPVMRQTPLPGAILTRVASSHIRVGTFEFAAAQNSQDLIQSLMDYTIERHYPNLIESDQKAIALLKAVVLRQADLIIEWMRVGFIHGVMNTDNMTLSGETIDYGPCAFIDAYDPKTVFSSIDHRGRYAYANQPRIAQWNIARLAEALLPLIDDDEKKAVAVAQEAVLAFSDIYKDKWLEMMRAKLGLYGALEGDAKLIADILKWMQTNHADYTNTFRDLSQADKPSGKLYQQNPFDTWYRQWQARVQQNTEPATTSLFLMKKSNPSVIPRNHKVEQALKAAEAGDLQPFLDLLEVLKEPYSNSDALAAYQSPPSANERVHQTFCGT